MLDKFNSKMKEITFTKTTNIFINSGIVALEHYLKECKDNKSLGYNDYDFEMTQNELNIKCDSQEHLFTLLEDIYYYMGRDVYDCSKDDGNKKYYFKKEPFETKEFGKMTTYGLGGLITKPPFGPQPTPRKKENSVAFESLFNNEPEFAKKISNFYFERGLKLKKFDFLEDGTLVKNKNNQQGDSKIFLNEPYTKTPKLVLKSDYFEKGDKSCSLTGWKYKKLMDIGSVSPFISGEAGKTKNFESFNSVNKSKPVSWHAMYLFRFSPKLALYNYAGKYEIINVFLFDSDNLINIKQLFQNNLSFFKDETELKNHSFRSNFKLFRFGKEREEKFTEKNELAFMLIYTFYRQFLHRVNIEEFELKPANYNPFEVLRGENIPISLKVFKADKFATTMRPNSFEVINNFKYLIRLIFYLEKKGVNFYHIIHSLKILKPSEKSGENSIRVERLLRNNVFGNIIKNKPIVNEIEKLFIECYKILVTSEKTSVGFKNFNQLLLLFELYEPLIKFGGNKYMDKNLQQKAINLGKSIGQGILNYGEESKQNNAKTGKSYIIALKKARTLKQFLDEITRLQNKYAISVSNEILENINEQNFIYIKQFSLISALNQLNSVLKPIKHSENEEK